jgi:hypothetical protein
MITKYLQEAIVLLVSYLIKVNIIWCWGMKGISLVFNATQQPWPRFLFFAYSCQILKNGAGSLRTLGTVKYHLVQ